MRLGVMLFLRSAQIGVAPPLARIAEFSALIEEKGFTGLWFADSVGRGYATLDPLCVLCALAGTPGHIELGTAILQVPLRQPRELAYRIQTVNALTAGRLRLGVGAGSTRTDFEALDADYDTRLMTLPRSIATMQAMWRNESDGQHALMPWPGTEGGPPIYLGAWRSPKWITFAAQQCDGWIASGLYTSWSDLETGIHLFRQAGGGRAILASVLLDLITKQPPDPARAKGISLVCSPEEARERLSRLEQLGIDDVLVICPIDQPQQLEILAGTRIHHPDGHSSCLHGIEP